MNTSIKVENLSKAYQLGEFSTGTLSRDLERWWAIMRGKEDPFLKIGETNDRSLKGNSDIVWSLKELNFEVKQGDTLGIIGNNGAGKSTLLKILSRVTSPTTGTVKVKGRIASLLEVGTGFHPELTGRENIFLNGAILGMRKKEIKRRFDEIVDFAGVERYIDTPVKRYSSGMYVRLAFAVAAHLESEILIVDEVLAVGDAEFQKKCLGKMDEVSRGQGRTLFFVSHNMGAIRQLCRTGLVLQNGQTAFQGNIDRCIAEYITLSYRDNQTRATGKHIIKHVELKATGGYYFPGCGIQAHMTFNSPAPIKNATMGIMIKEPDGSPLVAVNNKHFTGATFPAEISSGVLSLYIPRLPLAQGKYIVDFFLGDYHTDVDSLYDRIMFEVEPPHNTKLKLPHQHLNKIHIEKAEWDYKTNT